MSKTDQKYRKQNTCRVFSRTQFLFQDTDNGVIYTFNPITGAPLGVLTKLNYKIKQTMLLHTMTETFLRSIVIIDNNDEIHVFPENSDSVVASASKNTYLFTVDRKTGILTGLSFSYSSPQKLVAHKVWELVFSPKTQVITHVASKNPIERVHSQGRVLGDRSVLYKYVNPNLVAIVTQGVSGSQKSEYQKKCTSMYVYMQNKIANIRFEHRSYSEKTSFYKFLSTFTFYCCASLFSIS